MYEPSEGTVSLDGKILNGMPTYKIAAAGLSRTFQNIRLFKDLSVLENVLIAMGTRKKSKLIESFLRLPGYYKQEAEMKKKPRIIGNL